MRTIAGWLLAAALLLPTGAAAFDHAHTSWSTLLAAHVRWNAEGTATSVDYAGFARQRTDLSSYLAALSAVERAEFERWSKSEQLAFLINAYNAYTVELILGAYPKLESIKDLGSLLSSPWKKRFFRLLGEQRHLDDVEHGLIRGAPDFDEPRIHFAVNCASIGCPALRPEAFRAAELEAQLEDQTRRFFADRSRNRWDAGEETLYLSAIFDWYGSDFETGWRGTDTVAAFAARYADALGVPADTVAKLAADEVEIEFLDYDWALNSEKAR
jgi:hypothetical protein